MAYVFGINVPVIEIFLVSTLFTIILFILLIYISIQIHKVKKGFNVLLKEEHVIKKELDETLSQEGKQLKLITSVVKELRNLEGMIGSSGGKIKVAKRAIQNLDYNKITKNQEKFFVAMEKILIQLNDLDNDYEEQRRILSRFVKKHK